MHFELGAQRQEAPARTVTLVDREGGGEHLLGFGELAAAVGEQRLPVEVNDFPLFRWEFTTQ